MNELLPGQGARRPAIHLSDYKSVCQYNPVASAPDDLVRTVIIVIAVIFLFPVLLMLLFAPTMGAHMGWTGDGNLLWMLPWIVLFFAIGYLIYRTSEHLGETDALQELRLAYARGDLTDDEYEERRKRLTPGERKPRTDTED